MTSEDWEASATGVEKIAARWLRMATERKQRDASQEYYFSESKRLMDMASLYRMRAKEIAA
jgi:hypothetical protein